MNMKAALPDETTESRLETSDRKPRTIGLIILLVSFGIFGTWAALAPLESAAIAPGVVTVKGNRKTVQHLEGGIVKEILVSDGEKVDEGQPLLILDKTQFGAELGVLRGQYFTELARENRLVAEREDNPSVEFSRDLKVGDARAEEAMENQIQIFEARKSARDGEQEVLEQRISQLESQIEGLDALVATKQELIASFEEEIADLTELLDEGFVEKTRVVELRRSLARTRGEIAEHQASIAQARMRIGETRLEILQLNKQFKTEVVNELAATQAEVFDLKERITAIEDRVERTVMRAPVSGTVLGLNAHTIGGVIQGGTPILDIVPENQELIIEARVKPGDIDSVEAGQTANIRFSAFSRRTTPMVEGKVTKVAADRLVDEQSGQAYYPTTVEVTKEGLQTETLAGLTIVPGMPADVLIKTGQRTLLQYLTQPARDAMALSLKEE